MTEPIMLEPRDLQDVWDDIKPRLKEVKGRWPEVSDWRVEDIYAAVKNGDAVIYATEDGFAVCTFEPLNSYSPEKDLFIWVAYVYKEKRGGMWNKYLPSFIDLAKRLKCEGIRTISNSSAISGKMEPLYTVYRMTVNG